MTTSHSTENYVVPKKAFRILVAFSTIWGFIIGVITCLVVHR